MKGWASAADRAAHSNDTVVAWCAARAAPPSLYHTMLPPELDQKGQWSSRGGRRRTLVRSEGPVGVEEGVRLLDDGRAVEGLLHPVASRVRVRGRGRRVRVVKVRV